MQKAKKGLERVVDSPLVLGVLVLLLMLGPRLADLDVFYGPDETSWIGRSAAFTGALSSGQLQDTYQTGHPGVTLLWVETLASWLGQGLDSVDGSADWDAVLNPDRDIGTLGGKRQASATANALLMTLAVLIIRRLFGSGPAWLSGFLIAFDPFLLTESRALRSEGLLAAFSFLALLSFLLYWKERRIGYGALAGLLTGLSLLSKVSAVSLLPVGLAVFVLAVLWRGAPRQASRDPTDTNGGHAARPGWRNALPALLLWGGVTALTVFVFWPALWVNPAGVFQQVYDYVFLRAVEGGGGGRLTFFMGSPTTYQELGPLFYPVVILFRTGPWVWFGLILLGLGMWKWNDRRWSRANKISIGIMVLYLLVYLALITRSGLKFDRYVVPMLPVLDMMAALGLVTGFERLRAGRSWSPVWSYAAALLVLVTQLGLALTYHPYYYSYWNPLLGGARQAVKVLPVGVGYEGIEQIAHHFDQMPDAGNIKLASANSGKIRPMFRGETIAMTNLDGYWFLADYTFIYISQYQRGKHSPEIIDYLRRQTPVYSMSLGGLEYGWVYPGPGAQYHGGDTTLEGRAALRAFNLSHTQLQAGQTLTVTVFFRNAGQQPGDKFFVQLSDGSDYVWAEGVVAARPGFEQEFNTQGAIVEGEASLQLPPGMPPAPYLLKMGYRLADSGQLIGRFDLPPGVDDISVLAPDAYPTVGTEEVPNPINQAVLDELLLLGYDLDPGKLPAGDSSWLTLFWQALTDVDRDYVLGIQLLDEDQKEIAYWLGRPVFSSQSTDQWQVGQLVQDPWLLTVPEGTQPGRYQLALNLYDADSTEQLASIQLGSLKVPYQD